MIQSDADLFGPMSIDQLMDKMAAATISTWEGAAIDPRTPRERRDDLLTDYLARTRDYPESVMLAKIDWIETFLRPVQ